MIVRTISSRIQWPPNSGIVVDELIREDVSAGTVTATSNVRGVLSVRPATTDESQWEADQIAEQAAQLSEADALGRLDVAADVLRGWASDASAVVAAWDGASDAQKDQWVKVTIDRLGKLIDNLADVLITIGVRREIV